MKSKVTTHPRTSNTKSIAHSSYEVSNTIYTVYMFQLGFAKCQNIFVYTNFELLEILN